MNLRCECVRKLSITGENVVSSGKSKNVPWIRHNRDWYCCLQFSSANFLQSKFFNLAPNAFEIISTFFAGISCSFSCFMCLPKCSVFLLENVFRTFIDSNAKWKTSKLTTKSAFVMIVNRSRLLQFWYQQLHLCLLRLDTERLFTWRYRQSFLNRCYSRAEKN